LKTLAGNSMMSEQLQIAIVGGGIGGLTAALALRARGLNVTVFEQAGEQREIGAGISILQEQAQQLEARRDVRYRLELQLSRRDRSRCNKLVHGVAFLCGISTRA
jgi:glycine/D-amino acid oxidase-like deaminating enzyme